MGTGCVSRDLRGRGLALDLDLDRAVLLAGDCRERLRVLPECSIDACVTDPPYELGFMAKTWDQTGVAFDPATWAEALRVLKPGAHAAIFGGTRTFHRLAVAIEDAGFEIRDCLMWLYGQGFPKSLTANTGMPEGQGTALKPAWEPIVLCRKPLAGTVRENVQQWGTGGLQIDECRISGGPPWRAHRATGLASVKFFSEGDAPEIDKEPHAAGRWPANVLLDEESAAKLDEQTADLRIGGTLKGGEGKQRPAVSLLALGPRGPWQYYGDSGGASRFFYVAKTARSERDLYCEQLPPRTGGEATDRVDGSIGVDNPRAGAGRTGGARNFHPTVKPITLLRYLIKLVTPTRGIVLDPFAGSGSTAIAALLEGRRFFGVELGADYFEIARARVQGAHDHPERAA